MTAAATADTFSRHQFPKDVGAHGVVFLFREYVYGGGGTVRGSVLLPIPRNIVDSYIVNVDKADLGVLGAGTVELVKQFNSGASRRELGRGLALDSYAAVRDGAMSLIKSGTGGVTDDVASVLKFMARAGMTSIPGGAQISNAVDVIGGSAVNPHSTVVFEGVNLKNFTFDWQFAPTSQADSQALRDTINTIKRAALPEYSNLAGNPNGTTGTFIDRALLKYPQMVDIHFVGIDSSYFVKHKTCMIKSVNVDYTNQSGPVLLAGPTGSRPAFVNLTLELIETEIHTRRDVPGAP